MQGHLNENIKIYHNDIWANRWLGFRLEMIGCIVVVLVSLFSVIQRDKLNPGTAGLSISYALSVSV